MVFAVYAFARAADDFADEPEFHGQRQSALTNWEDELIRTFHGESDHPIFVALQQTVEACDLPITLFKDLLAGFRMDLAPRTFVSLMNCGLIPAMSASRSGVDCPRL